MDKAALRADRCHRRAFTLLEMAIVLGIAGVIFSGVWVAATAFWRNHQRTSTINQVMQIVQNVRDYYGPSAGVNVWPGAGTDMTNTINGLHLVPMEMRVTPTSDTSLLNHQLGTVAGGGSLLLESQGTAPMILRVRLRGLAKDDCINLLLRMPVLSPEVGMKRIGTSTGNTTIDLVTNFNTPGGAVTLPLTFTQANAWCNLAGKTNEVRFDFGVRN